MKLKDEAVAALHEIIKDAVKNGEYKINEFGHIDIDGMVVSGQSTTNHVSIGVGFDDPELANILERMEVRHLESMKY
jgi:hypothetical protein